MVWVFLLVVFYFFPSLLCPPRPALFSSIHVALHIYAVFLVPFSLCASPEGGVRPGFCAFLAQCAGVITFGGPRQASVSTMKSPFSCVRDTSWNEKSHCIVPRCSSSVPVKRAAEVLPVPYCSSSVLGICSV